MPAPLPGRLHFFCGKMAAGKSTLAQQLAAREGAILLAQDELLAALYPGAIADLRAFAECSTRIQAALAPHIGALLSKGLSVVLDFPANTKRQRAWFRQLLDASGAEHALHLIDASDALCKQQLRLRSAQRGLAPGTKWTTDADFDEVTAYFDPPSTDEGFNVVRHVRAA